ncbi:MAG: alpha-hydroxy-acid oxidizing protein, partial [Aeromicrobium sp.]
LGADTAWIGRPVLWHLERGGAPAVSGWLSALRAELASIFALTGVRTPADCHPGLLRRRDVAAP